MDPRPARTVLVLGANGRFGAAAVQAFADAGWQVLAQARRTPSSLPAGATHVAIRLEDGETLAAAALGATVVVHAVNPVYTQWARDAMPLLRNGLDVAQRLGALFMLPGNVYNYGTQLPALLTEDTPAHPDHAKARIRVAMEAELQQAAAAGALRATVIRAGDFYGCGRGSWLDQAIVRDLHKGRLVYPGRADQLDLPHAWAYLPDLAAAFVAVASAAQPATPFQTLHFSGHTLTGRQLLQGLTDAAADLGLLPAQRQNAAQGLRVRGLPWGAMRLMGLVSPMMRELVRMRYLWTRPHALSGSRLAQQAGPLRSTPPAVALRQALLDLNPGAAGHAKALSSRRAAA